MRVGSTEPHRKRAFGRRSGDERQAQPLELQRVVPERAKELEATDSLRRTAGPILAERFRPLVAERLEAAGARAPSGT